MKSLTFAGGLIAAVLLGPVPTCGQGYFNERYALSPIASVSDNILPDVRGYWLGGIALNATGNSTGLFLQRVNLLGTPSGPAKQWFPATGSFDTALGTLLPVTAGGLMMVGNMSSGITAGMLWRFDDQGDTLWTRTYLGPPGGALIFRSGRQLPNGDFVLVGEHYQRSSSSNTELLLLLTDSSGHERWRRTYDVTRYETVMSVLPTQDGGFLLSGATRAVLGTQPGNSDAVLLKTDALGQEQWRRIYGGPYDEEMKTAFPTPRGGYVVTMGVTERAVGIYEQRRPGLVWVDSAGNVLRQRFFGAAWPSLGIAGAHQLPDGGYLISGQSADTTGAPLGRGYATGFALRVCADGDSVWYRTYRVLTGGQSYNYLRDMRPTPDGGFVGAGFYWVRPPDTGVDGAWVFKTDQYGYLQPGGAPPTVQCRPTGLPGELIMNNEQWAVWPNPSADGRFTLTPPPAPSPIGRGSLSLTVTDALGREVWRGARETSPSTGGGRGEVVVDLSRCAPGLYVLQVVGADGRQRTYKLLRE